MRVDPHLDALHGAWRDLDFSQERAHKGVPTPPLACPHLNTRRPTLASSADSGSSSNTTSAAQ